MGHYHLNLTDKAVLKRVKLAAGSDSKKLSFTVPKARKKFLITILKEGFIPADEATTHESIYGTFTLEEVVEE